MLQLAADGGDTPAVRASLDAARERYLAMHAEAEAIAQSAIVAAKRRDGAGGPPPAPGAAPLKVRIARRIPPRHRRRLRGLADLPARQDRPLTPCRRSASSFRSTTSRRTSAPAWTRSPARPSRTSSASWSTTAGRTPAPPSPPRYAERDPRFKLVSQANRGLSGARNTGTRHATGEYLAFVDSDDVLPPNAYELLLGALEQTGSDFATGNVQRLTRWGTFQANFLVADVHADRARHARDALPPAARRPDRVEQALPALVLGRAGLRVPRGPDPRGHPRDHPGAVRREVGRRHLRPRLLLADPRGRRPLDHAAAARAQGAQRPHAGGRGGLGLPRGARPARREALVRGERRGRRPAAAPQRARPRRRRLPAAVPRARQRLPRRRVAARSTAGSPRSTGSSGTSSAGGCCPSCSRSCASRRRTSPPRRRSACAAAGTATTRSATTRG